jgi:hypothetical protein
MTIQFDRHTAGLLNALGYVCTQHPASWEDVGDAESGPQIAGGPAFDEWTLDDSFIIVVDGEVVEYGTQMPCPPDFPF